MSRFEVSGIQFVPGGAVIMYLDKEDIREGGNLFMSHTVEIGEECSLWDEVHEIQESLIDTVKSALSIFRDEPVFVPEDEDEDDEEDRGMGW